MTRLAIIEPKTLVGDAVRKTISDFEGSFQSVDLFTTEESEVGAVTEVDGEAALVQAMTDESLSNADVAVFCGTTTDLQVLAWVPTSVRAIVVDPDRRLPDAVPAVAGVSEPAVIRAPLVASPSPAVIMLAHLLAPMGSSRKVTAAAHVLLPASSHNQAGLDELFHQTRSILTMSEDPPIEVFGTQLAFNLLPWRGESAGLSSDLRSILGPGIESHIHLSQAGVFHSLTAGIFLTLRADPGLEKVCALLLEDPMVKQVEDPELLGPVTAAASDKILLGEVLASPPNSYWIRCTLDNLAASAINALRLAS